MVSDADQCSGILGAVISPAAVPAEAQRRADLARMKMVATSLLLLAAVIFVIARLNDHRGVWVGFVEAGAEAAMVGALADWFAVTALFKHPLGLPIPHTAIIQTRKDQIGESLGGFVRDNFLTSEIITERLRDANLASRLGDWLCEPDNARTVSAQSAAVVKGVTEVLQDDMVQGGIEQLVMSRARSVSVSPIMGRVVDAAVVGDHHQVLLGTVLQGLGKFLDENRSSFRERLDKESPWWVPEPLDDVVFEKIYLAVQSFLADLGADRDHPMRIDIDRRIEQLAKDLKTSEAMAKRGDELKEELLNHPEVRAWSASLWTNIKRSLLEATEDPGSELRGRLDQALIEAGKSLQTDPALQERIDKWIVEATSYVAEQFRSEVSDLIANTVQNWDTEETADRLEVQVGRDLQFIRINGTLVGGLAGVAIHAISRLL